MATAKTQLALHGQHIPKDGTEPLTVVYVADIPAIASGQNTPPIKVLIDADHDFYLTAISHVTFDAQAPVPMKIQIQADVSQGAALFPQPAYLQAVSGTAQQPYILPIAMRFAGGQNIRVNAAAD